MLFICYLVIAFYRYVNKDTGSLDPSCSRVLENGTSCLSVISTGTCGYLTLCTRIILKLPVKVSLSAEFPRSLYIGKKK